MTLTTSGIARNYLTRMQCWGQWRLSGNSSPINAIPLLLLTKLGQRRRELACFLPLFL